jgi:ferric-dicitrate binding protein FerR (iron transport regulator)
MKTADQIGKLMFKHARKKTSEKEELELSDWRSLFSENEKAFQYSIDTKSILREVALMIDSKERVMEKIREQIPAAAYQPRKRRALIIKMTKIAAIFLVVMIALMLNPFGKKDPKLLSAFVSPDGTIIAMDDIHRGFLSARAGLHHHTDENGKEEWLASNFPGDPKDKNFKLVSALRGYLTLRLPDSVSIWLNKHTAFQYPANFSQDSIHLLVEGEGYLEGHDPRVWLKAEGSKQKAFWLSSLDGSFNIKAYPDSVLEITVIKGSLTLTLDSAGRQTLSGVQLGVGQQAQLINDSLAILQSVDIRKVISWKN